MAVANPKPLEPQPFDEDAVLRDLEQLRGQILEARSQREKKAAEFDAFVKDSRAKSQAERLKAVEHVESTTRALSAARTADRATVAPRVPAAPSPVAPAQASALFSPPPAFPATDDDGMPVSRRVVIPRAHLDRPRRDLGALLKTAGGLRLGIAALAVAVVAVVIFSFSGSNPAPAEQQAPPSTPAPVASQAAAPAASPSAPAAEPDPRPIQIELEALRPVWMQVVVDGRREIGRTVPQGQRLSFGANTEIALRAGDAGAVRVYVAGADRGVLGRDGQVVNRRFTK
jgi:hypothetical protein